MARGNWSFLHEWVIYDYLMARKEERTLRFKQVISDGQLLGRTKWVKVKDLYPITSTGFPDVEGIQLKGNNLYRPAEIKFTCSTFNYHKNIKYQSQYNSFKKSKGFLLVVKHDYLPKGLLESYLDIDVFEIELNDFTAFCRENFSRLLNRQIKSHEETRVWIMYQGPNFNKGIGHIRPARESKIWCPTENLTGFDLAIGDRVMFIKTKGISRIPLQADYLKKGEINEKWILEEIYIGEIKSKVYSRNEYLQHKNKPIDTQLWRNDENKDGHWRWNRVFQFSGVKVVKRQIAMEELYNVEASKDFVLKSWEAFCFGKSREISLRSYRNLLESLV